jgi:hypothetical protein
MAAKFASAWGTLIPDRGDLVAITCPQCGSGQATMDRVGNTVYGSHETPGGCGWTAGLAVLRHPETRRELLWERSG